MNEYSFIFTIAIRALSRSIERTKGNILTKMEIWTSIWIKNNIGRIQTSSEKNISTTQCEQKTDPWLPDEDEYQGRPGSLEQKEGEREKEISCLRGETCDPISEGMKQFSFTKNERLHKSREFDEIFRKGERYPTENFLVIFHPNHYERRRLGIVVSKKIGKAVERNRIKRLVREFFRLNKSQFPDSSDLLFVVKRRLEKPNYATVYDELKAVFESHPFKKMQQNP